MPKIDPIRTKNSPDLGVGSANEWGCSKFDLVKFLFQSPIVLYIILPHVRVRRDLFKKRRRDLFVCLSQASTNLAPGRHFFVCLQEQGDGDGFPYSGTCYWGYPCSGTCCRGIFSSTTSSWGGLDERRTRERSRTQAISVRVLIRTARLYLAIFMPSAGHMV
jgi:hypothetical protein